MKKVVTIDFDIIMHPSIEVYNDSDMSVDEYLSKYNFLGIMGADLELYQRLTNFILGFDKDKIKFIYSHKEIVRFIKEKNEIIDLYNIDHHHDLGYGERTQWATPLKTYNDGNWVKKLWDLKLINKYIWLKDYNSSDVVSRGNKFLTDKHFIFNFNLSELSGADELYLCLSPEWVPQYYKYLYDLWKDLIL